MFERSSAIKLELNKSTNRNAWLGLRDASPWRATKSEEFDVVWCNRYFVFLHAALITSETIVHHDRAR